ncbi:tRNA (adenosine(37)-N6)-dimethylallyltransferase MiaA [Streptococcaceae bacterium ESL0729]|nr:tRNA (adenosine(37)-N6)-dimethylallyltransferase MiaA [Streptococcaceae bacterium ESL0729]
MKNKLLVIAGPTAVGKTALGIKLAQIFNGEIINGDSQQVYQGLDIGTAKASREEQEMVPHHLIDVKRIDEDFSAHDFTSQARKLIDDISSRGKVPIIVGGTGLYLQALLEGYHLGGSDNHDMMRARREELELMDDQGLEEIFKKVGLSLPEPNRRRIIREIEKYELATNLENNPLPYDSLIIGLNMERPLLYDRINQRVDLMVDAGILDEAGLLFKQFPQVQATRAIGYKEFFPYFRGEVDLTSAVETVKKNTRHYAKRQLTWFKNRMKVDFYDVLSEDYPSAVLRDVEVFLHEEDNHD